jgi:hypothetical protein
MQPMILIERDAELARAVIGFAARTIKLPY